MTYYMVDAFTDEIFKGNPAGVCLLDKWPDSNHMQNIASENNLAETAFVVCGADTYELRWFTPEVEMDLCGHATLASAFVIANFVDKNAAVMKFATRSGILTVRKTDEIYEMDFPARKPEQVEVTRQMGRPLGCLSSKRICPEIYSCLWEMRSRSETQRPILLC